MFKRVLVANRGEIALRIIRTLREMRIESVAVYSDADRPAPFVTAADEAFRIGPPPAAESYLNQEAIVEAALRSRSEAIHPGYGFLAENAGFAARVAEAGLVFIGPSPEAMGLLGDKIAARNLAVEARVPVVPGTDGPVASVEEAAAFANVNGFPVMIKAAGGGGGRGMRIVENEADLSEALERAGREAGSYFGNSQVYLERYFPGSRHVEVQIVGGRDGVVLALGERDCSTQRRRQKLIEETPGPGLPEEDRQALFQCATALAARAGYVGVGTVEFLYAGPGRFYFMEMNARIQVEHTITEQVTGVDLVRESVRIAAGLDPTPPPTPRGHAIEARINAEDPASGFAPGAGALKEFRPPAGPGVRVDSGVEEGGEIPSFYDSLIAKLIVHAPDREQAIARLRRALLEFRISGVPTTSSLIESIVRCDQFERGEMTTDWLDQNLGSLVEARSAAPEAASVTPPAEPSMLEVEVNGRRFVVRVHDDNTRPTKSQRSPAAARSARPRPGGNAVVSPMHGTVMAVRKEQGDRVEPGEPLFVVEAMKMENEVPAPRAGILARVLVSVGDSIDVNQVLAELELPDGH